MTVLEKAEKALEFLKNNGSTSKIHELQNAVGTLGKCMGTLGGRDNDTAHFANLLPFAIPTLLNLASHNSAELRLVADEALNRLIVGGSPYHAYKINIYLQNKLDSNQNPRWIRAVLSRICLGTGWLRPGPGKIRTQAQSIFQKMTDIVRNNEESLQLVMETMEGNLPRISKALADYATDDEIFHLISAFYGHMESSEPQVRRSVAICLATLCLHRTMFIPKVMNTAIDKLWPEMSSENVTLGWFGVIKCIFHINPLVHIGDNVVTLSDFLQLYQLCIHYLQLSNCSHNIHNAVLECLTALLQNCGSYRSSLVETSHSCNVVLADRNKDKKHKRSVSSISAVRTDVVVTPLTLTADDLSVVDQTDQLIFTGALSLGSLSHHQTPHTSEDDLSSHKTPDSPQSEANSEVDPSEFPMKLDTNTSRIDDVTDMKSQAESEDDTNDVFSHKIIDTGLNIGSESDEDVRLKHCARLITLKFLLTGNTGGVQSDRAVRVSVKASALNCLAAIFDYYPDALTMYMDKDVDTACHNISATSDVSNQSMQESNEYVLERNVCYQDSLTESFAQDLLNKSVDSQIQSQDLVHERSTSISSRLVSTAGEMHKGFKISKESLNASGSLKDIPSNLLDSKHTLSFRNTTNSTSVQSSNPALSNSNFTTESNMTNSNEPQSTDYPSTSGDLLSSSIDLDMKFDHFGESTSNIGNFDTTVQGNQSKSIVTTGDDENYNQIEDKTRAIEMNNVKVHTKRLLERTDEVFNEEIDDSNEINERANEIGKCDYIEKCWEKNQHMSDIYISLENHSDPQIKGLVRICLANFVNAALEVTKGDYLKWKRLVALPKDISERFNIENIVDIVLEGLTDRVHSCVNHSLTALGVLIECLSSSSLVTSVPAILNALHGVEANQYWLCKVNLCKLYGKLPCDRLYYVLPDFQSRTDLVMETLHRFLADPDHRVRKEASDATVESLPTLYPSATCDNNQLLTSMIAKQTQSMNFTQNPLELLNEIKQAHFLRDLPTSMNMGNNSEAENLQENLKYVVTSLVAQLMETGCKDYTQGLLECLHDITQKYSPWNYPASYDSCGIFELCLDLMESQCTHVQAINTLMGIATQIYCVEMWNAMNPECKKTKETSNLLNEEIEEQTPKKWHHIHGEQIATNADKILQFTLKMLNISVHLIDETNPITQLNRQIHVIGLPKSPQRRKHDSQRRSTLPNIDQHGVDDKKSTKNKFLYTPTNAVSAYVGSFANEPYYMKLYENLRAVYSNHKIILEPTTSIFYKFLSTILNALAVQLEFSTEKEFGCITEEILHYLKVLLPLQPDKTVFCVTQLLKCLFSTNIANQYGDYRKIFETTVNGGVFSLRRSFEDIIINSIVEQTNIHVEENSNRNSESRFCQNTFSIDKNVGLVREKDLLLKMEEFARSKWEKKWGTNKQELEHYIRAFEPVVIQSLKSYTMQNDITLQCRVMSLLNQLLALRVNYLMLDSDQVFIGFVLKQLENVEHHEIPECGDLVNCILTFLINLSLNTKHPSKQLMDIPKLIQLCDGVLASGRHTECVAALRPLVWRVFSRLTPHATPLAAPLATPQATRANAQDAQVTREVVFYTLQKIMHEHKVLDLITSVLIFSLDQPESYYRWSELAADSLLIVLKQRTLALNSVAAVNSLERLIDTVYKDVMFDPIRIEMVLKVLFDQPPNQNTSTLETKEKWLATVSVLIRKVLIHIPESEIFLSLNNLKATFISPAAIFFNVKTEIDPLNVQNINENCANLSPDVILVRFLFRVLTYVILESDSCQGNRRCNMDRIDSGKVKDYRFLFALAINCVCQVKQILHLTDGCRFPSTAKMAQTVLHNEQSGLNTGLYSPEENIPLERLNTICLKHSYKFPLLTVHWSHLLIRLKFLEQKYWQKLLGFVRSSPLNTNTNNGVSGIQFDILQIGCCMAFCEYFVENGLGEAIHLTWLLVSRIQTLVGWYRAQVVHKLVVSVHRNPSASGLLLQAQAARCQHCIKGQFALNAYSMLKGCHESQSGALIFLICRLIGQLQPAIAMRFVRLAKDRCKYLQTLDPELIGAQLTKEDVQVALEILHKDRVHVRYPTLVKELNKLASAIFDLSPLDLSQERLINPQHIRTTELDSKWLLTQMKNRCCQIPTTRKINGLNKNLARFLSDTNIERLNSIFACPEFDRTILRSCFQLSCQNYLQTLSRILSEWEITELSLNKTAHPELTLPFDKLRRTKSKSQFFVPISKSDYIDSNIGSLETKSNEKSGFNLPELPHLFVASMTALEKYILGIVRLFPKQNRPLSQSENFALTPVQTADRYAKRCQQVFRDNQFHGEFITIQSVITSYFDVVKKICLFSNEIDCEIQDTLFEMILPVNLVRNLALFSVISLQYCSYLIKNEKVVEPMPHSDVSFRNNATNVIVGSLDSILAVCVGNACKTFEVKSIWNELNTDANINKVQSAINCLYSIVKYCVKDTKPIVLSKYLTKDNGPLSDTALTCDKLLSLIQYWERQFYDRRFMSDKVISDCMKKWLEGLIVSLARCDFASSIALIPPLAWGNVDISNCDGKVEKIDLPIQDLQDMDVLQSFLFRLNLIGWTSKKQFEEIWMSLLGALQGNGTHWAVLGISQLLLSTLPRQAGQKGYLHCPSTFLVTSVEMHKLKEIVVNSPQYLNLFEDVNLESMLRSECRRRPSYRYGQFSIEYLQLASEMTDSPSYQVSKVLKSVRKHNAESGVDINSCLQLLMDVSTQMLEPQSPTGLCARCALLSCLVCISSLFCESGQWYRLVQQLAGVTNTGHEELVQHCLARQPLLYGLTQAFTVLHSSEAFGETNNIQQNLIKSLSSSFAPIRQAALQGCLLQMSRLGSAPDQDHELLKHLRQAVHQNLMPNTRISPFEQGLWWSVLFALAGPENQHLLMFAASQLVHHPRNHTAPLIMKGIVNVLRSGVPTEDYSKAIIKKILGQKKLAKEQEIQIWLLQLFLDNKTVSTTPLPDFSDMDPQQLVSSMDQIKGFYKDLRDCYSQDIRSIIGETLKYYICVTLPPTAILRHVVTEFLQCCKEAEERRDCFGTAAEAKWQHCAQIAAEVVFEVFETSIALGQFSVLSSWLFEALCYLLSGNVSTGLVPCVLLCLLVSASEDRIVRSLFPIALNTLKLGLDKSICQKSDIVDQGNRNNLHSIENDGRRVLPANANEDCGANFSGAKTLGNNRENHWFSKSLSNDDTSFSFTDRRLLCLVATHSSLGNYKLEKLEELCIKTKCLNDLLKCLNVEKNAL